MAVAQRNYYQILGVTPEATDREIKRSYHRLARKMHPDRAGGEDDGGQREEEFAMVSTAYNVLKDKGKRKDYDGQLGKGTAETVSASQGNGSGNGKSKDAADSSTILRKVSDTGETARAAIAKKAYSRGMQLYNVGEFAKAIEFFEAAIQNKKDEGIYYARTAKAMMNCRRSFTKAREMALKAIELDAYNVDFRLCLAEICEMAGSSSLAIQAYKDVLKWDAENLKVIAHLAELEASQNPSIFKKILSKVCGR